MTRPIRSAEVVLFAGVLLATLAVAARGDVTDTTQVAPSGECLNGRDIDNWIDVLTRLTDEDVNVVFPGYGPFGGPEVLTGFRDYLLGLRDQVAWQISQGRSYETTLANVDVPNAASYCRDSEAMADDVKAVYAQLTAELPSPPPGHRPRALVLIGDHFHPPAYIRPPLQAVFDAVGMPAVFTYDVTKLTADNLANFDLLVVLRDGMIWPDGDEVRQFWMTDEQAAALDAFVRNGGGFLALHNATALRTLNDDANVYRDLLGSSYHGHGDHHEKFAVRVVNTEHPVTQGVRGFMADDERHHPILHADDATILTEAVSGDQTSVNGYVRTHGRGRVCYLANGHNRKVLENPQMQKLLRNAVVWCVGMSQFPQVSPALAGKMQQRPNAVVAVRQ